MQIIGHRGARREAPENTLGGFRHIVDCFDLDFNMGEVGHQGECLLQSGDGFGVRPLWPA